MSAGVAGSGRNFVLVHGAWHGGWCWREVAALLRARGHAVHAPTLTGLGERVHLATPETDLDTHVDDVVNAIRFAELDDIVLVGHSYGGFVVTGVASALADRIAALVYLDAFLPGRSGDRVFDRTPPARRAELERAADAFDGWRIPPETIMWTWSDDPVHLERLKRLATPQPIRCFRVPLVLSGAERSIARRTYILCERYRPSPFWPFYEACAADEGWRTARLPAMHDAMLSHPAEVAALLEAA